MKYNDNGTYKDIYVKSYDTLPIGTEVDYDGETVPTGWTEVNEVDSGTITITETGASGTISYKKVGRVVQLSISAKITTSVSGAWKSVQLATLPNKLKPLEIAGITVARDTQSTLFYVAVNTSGLCYISDRGRANLSSSNESIPATLTYISAE